MSAPMIALDGVGKRFRQTDEERVLLKRILQPHRRRAQRDLWALRDVDLRAAAGETVGIIGRNGSGKTTLLKLLSGVTAPTTGRVRVGGSVAPLIGVGVGFHPELTGRENVRVNGRLLGMSPAEVARKYDDIVAFSEIERFIDTPVKYYSSGMFLRLAFAVAISTEPDVFLLDEILAVGDLAFQLKCLERMKQIQDSGTTIVIVTHSLETLSRMSPRAIVLDRGRVAFDGDTDSAMSAYHEVMQRQYDGWDDPADAMLEEARDTHFAGGARVTVELHDGTGRPWRQFETGGPIGVRATIEFDREVSGPNVGVLVGKVGAGGIFTLNTFPGEYRGEHGPDRPLTLDLTLDNRLLSGTYSVGVGVFDRDGEFMLGRSENELLYVTSSGRGTGVVDLAPRLLLDGQPVELTTTRR